MKKLILLSAKVNAKTLFLIYCCDMFTSKQDILSKCRKALHQRHRFRNFWIHITLFLSTRPYFFPEKSSHLISHDIFKVNMPGMSRCKLWSRQRKEQVICDEKKPLSVFYKSVAKRVTLAEIHFMRTFANMHLLQSVQL